MVPNPKDATEAAGCLAWLPSLDKDQEKHSLSRNLESAVLGEISLAALMEFKSGMLCVVLHKELNTE